VKAGATSLWGRSQIGKRPERDISQDEKQDNCNQKCISEPGFEYKAFQILFLPEYINPYSQIVEVSQKGSRYDKEYIIA
jgi:hypothetical protein